MAKRKRKEDRPAQAAPVRTVTRAPVPSNRGTFAVARANRQLAEALPSVVYQRSEARREARPRIASAVPLQASDAPKPATPKTKTKTPPAPEARQQGLSLDKLPSGCKPRPTSSKGNGGSRAFVPWCRK